MSIADFGLADLIFSRFRNEDFPFNKKLREIASSSDFDAFDKYADNLEKEMIDYLSKRPKSSE